MNEENTKQMILEGIFPLNYLLYVVSYVVRLFLEIKCISTWHNLSKYLINLNMKRFVICFTSGRWQLIWWMLCNICVCYYLGLVWMKLHNIFLCSIVPMKMNIIWINMKGYWIVFFITNSIFIILIINKFPIVFLMKSPDTPSIETIKRQRYNLRIFWGLFCLLTFQYN